MKTKDLVMKRYLTIIMLVMIIALSTVQLVNASGVPAVDDQKLVVTIDGNPVDFSFIGEPMLLTTGRAFVPERFMSKYLGYNGHNPEYTEEIASQSVWLNDERTEVEMKLNKAVALVNGEERYLDYLPDGKPVLDSMPYTCKEKTYVPLRFICEIFGEKVDYGKIDGVHRIEITTKLNSPELYGLYYDDWDEIQPLAGYIIIKDNTVYFNEVEIVEWKNQKRVKELGLNKNDLPNGYIIINKNKEIETFQLTDEVKYTFTDINYLFVKEDAGNLRYTTASLDEFLKHLSVHHLNEITLSDQKIPYFIEIQDGKIKSITEELKYTI